MIDDLATFVATLELTPAQQAAFDADAAAARARQEEMRKAIADGTVGRNQVFVEYKDGTVIVANGNLKERLKTKVENTVIDLPPRAFKGWTQDGKVQAEISEDAVGKRNYFCDCPEFTYKDGNLVKKQQLTINPLPEE